MKKSLILLIVIASLFFTSCFSLLDLQEEEKPLVVIETPKVPVAAVRQEPLVGLWAENSNNNSRVKFDEMGNLSFYDYEVLLRKTKYVIRGNGQSIYVEDVDRVYPFDLKPPKNSRLTIMGFKNNFDAHYKRLK